MYSSETSGIRKAIYLKNMSSIHTPTASSSYTGTNLYVNGNTVVTIGPDGSYVPYSGTVANDGTMDNATGSAGHDEVPVRPHEEAS